MELFLETLKFCFTVARIFIDLEWKFFITLKDILCLVELKIWS